MPLLTDDELVYSPVVAHIYNKIYVLLPLESRMSMVDVEESPLFLSSRKALVDMASSALHNDIMKYSVRVLDQINETDNFLVLKQRSVHSLCSILIILRLMADLCKVHWDSKEPVQRKGSIDSNQSSHSLNSVISLGIGSESIDYHTVKPDKLDSNVVKKAIALISRLKSTNTLTQELALINGKSVPHASLYEDISTRPIFDDIDVNCSAILRFLAASNPNDFFDFTVTKLTILKHNIGNDGEFAPYLELFSAVYLDERLLQEYLRHIRVILATVKKAAYRQLVLSFFLNALRVWIASRPTEFLNATRPDSKVRSEADALFDELSQMPDIVATSSRIGSSQSGSRPLKTSFKFMAILLALNPSSIDQMLGHERQNVSTLKKLTNFSNTNRKQKLVSQVIKCLDQTQLKDSSENTSVLECVDFMVTLASVAASIYNLEPRHSIVEFSLLHYNVVSRVVVLIESNKPSPLLYNPSVTEHQLLQTLRMHYFSCICILRPKEAAPPLIDILNNENATLEALAITSSILSRLVSSNAFKSSNQSILLSMYPPLRNVMVRVGSLVKNNSYNPSLLDEDDAASLGKSASSASSIDHHSTHKQAIIDNLRTSTPSSNASTSAPKADKFKDTAKNLLKHHHSSGHVGTATSASSFTTTSLTDSSTILSDKENSVRVSQLSREILINGLELFKRSPHLYFYTFSDDDLHGKSVRLMRIIFDILEPLIIALKDSNLKLVQAGKHFLQSFVSVTLIPDNPDAIISAYNGSALLIYVLSKSITNLHASGARSKDILEHFVKLLEYRSNLYTILEHHSYFADIKKYEKMFQDLRSSVEECVLLALATPTTDTYGLIKRVFRALVRDFEALDSSFVYNADLYRAVANDTSLITGQVALQKNIRKFFLKVNIPTPAMINFWQRLYDRWYHLARSDYKDLTPNELSTFRNYAGVLAAVSGVFTDLEVKETAFFTADVRVDISTKVDAFVSQQFVMLGEDDLVTRENAKEILAFEVNPKTYPRVIKSLVSIIDDLTNREKNLTDRDLIIMEHTITLLKAVLDKGDDVTVFSMSIDILRCADKLAVIIDNRFDKDITTLKLRIRMSSLFSKVEYNNSKLVIRNAYKVRNKFLRYVYNWFEISVNYGCDCKDTEHIKVHDRHTTKEWEFIYIDVTIESVKALALLLDGLVLEAPQVLNERELKFSKSSLFSIYFNTLLRALERFSSVDSFPVSVRHKVSTVSDNIVLSLTNLLKSNVDVGLSYALPIGYYSNLAIRVSFLKVFVSIVESYSKTDLEKATTDKNAFVVRIFEVIIENPNILTAIGRSCPSNEAPALASCALSLASSMNQSAPMVAYLVNEEILSAMKYSDILRRNSFASRCLSAFGRTIGRDYLVSTLMPILTEIRDSEADLEVEKIDHNDPDAEQNLINFMHYLRKLVNVIISSKDSVPVEFRFVCKNMSNSVNKKFANSRLIAIGSFIFLRFFCPAIVSPESERIVDVQNRQTQRKFLLLAKVLQNMANGTVSSMKWPLLRSKEAELNELNDKICQFLDDLTAVDDNVEFETVRMSTVSENDFNFFHSYVYEHWDLVRYQYLSLLDSANDLSFFKGISHKVDEFFKLAGQPTMSYGYEMPAYITPEAYPELYEFMIKFSVKDLGPISEVPFIQNSLNQEGLHLVVFTYSEYEKVKGYDDELILYRLIQVFSRAWDQKFIFVIDCTGNDGTMLFPRHLMTRAGNLGPDMIRDNCQGVVYYNVSSGLYPILTTTLKETDTFQAIGATKFSFLSSMEDRKVVMNLGLSNQAVRVYNDVRVKFTDVSIFEPKYGRFEPIMLKIGNEYFQSSRTTPQRVKIRGELKEIFVNDVFTLEDIVTVAATETTSIPNEMTITFKNGSTIILASPKFLEIMRLLLFTKSKSLNASNQGITRQYVTQTVEDMFGQLFNVVFLGLTSSSHEVRSISYNLLAASQRHFQLDIGKDLAQFHEVYFPRDNNSFVVSISGKLAQTKPEITIEVVKSFFGVFNETISDRQRFSAILYIAPWVSNLYDYVYRIDDEHGRDYTAEIIRNFLSAASSAPMLLSSFSLSIFSKICQEDRINDILVDEIVLNAVDREAEGKDWKSSIAFLSSNPTVEICGYVVKRLRDITHIPFPNSNGKYSLESHSSWIEITVLTNIAVSMFFDSLMLTEMFLPDIFHSITILVDVGPLDLRTACHQLLLNVLQSFLTKKSLSDDSKSIIKSTVEHFTSHRSRLLFGLNRDNTDSFQSEISKFSTNISTMESLVASLMEVIEIAGGDMKPVWVTRWNRYALDAVCKADSVLRGRALVLLGILSKAGVSDELVRVVLGYVAEMSGESPDDPRFMYLAICTVFSLCKITEGLLPESTLFTKMFWLAVVITHSEHSALFQGGLKYVTSAIETMNIKEKFEECDVIGTLIKGKPLFGDMLERIEGVDKITITSENFDQVLLYFAVRGLHLPYARASSIQSLRSFFQVRFMNALMRASFTGSDLDTSPLSYLFFLYIVLKPSDLRPTLDDVDYEDDFIILGEQVHIPKVLVDFMVNESDAAFLTLYQACLYFSNSFSNEKTSLRFLSFLRLLGQRNPQLFIRVYPLIRTTLRLLIGNSSIPPDLAAEMFNVAAIANVMPEYHEFEKSISVMNGILLKYQLSGIGDYKTGQSRPQSSNSSSTGSSVTKLQRGFMIRPFIERMNQ